MRFSPLTLITIEIGVHAALSLRGCEGDLAFVTEAERLEVELHLGYAGRGACHAHCVVVADLDLDLPAWHVDGDVAIAEADAVSDGCCGAAAGA